MDIENKQEKATAEDAPNNYFKRQKAIPDWNQEIVSNKTALILGAGGLGSCVSIQLLRLGLKKIILVDYDVVDDHNLNRQIMYTIEDIGKSKVETAKKNLAFHNIGNTEIEAHHINAVTEWGKIISLAQESQLVFNLIDYGDYFDIAVQSLCIQLNLPMFQGGTFCNSLCVDYFTADGKPCLLCLTDGLKKELTDKLHPSLILSYTSLDFIPKNDNPEGQSNIVICQMCANFMNTFLLTELFTTSKKKSSRLLLYLDPVDLVSFDLEINPKCPFCREDYYKDNISHEVKSEDLPIKPSDLWNDVKTLQFQKLFPNMITEVQVVEGAYGQIDSKFQIIYKDGAKWSIKLIEVSSLNMSITYQIEETNPRYPCTKMRHTLQVIPTSENHISQINWKTEFQDDVPKNAFLDSQNKRQDYFADLLKTLTIKNLQVEEKV